LKKVGVAVFMLAVSFAIGAITPARMRVPKLAKNGFNSFFRDWFNP
jgi:hypothetical protein